MKILTLMTTTCRETTLSRGFTLSEVFMLTLTRTTSYGPALCNHHPILCFFSRLASQKSPAKSPTVASRKIWPCEQSHTHRMNNRVSTELYLFPKREMENIDKTLKRMTMICSSQPNLVKESITQGEGIRY